MKAVPRFAAIGCLAVAAAAAVAAQAAEAALKQLKAALIRAAFAVQEFTDEVHWAERYNADGTVTGKSMGRALAKHWSVAAGLLCITDDQAAADESADCREVWKAGSRTELRRPGSDSFPKEGILRRLK